MPVQWLSAILSHRCLIAVQVVLNLAKRAALAAGRTAPTQLSEGAAEAWKHVHWYLGGNPRLLCFFVENLGQTFRRDVWPDGTVQAHT